jgi:hypothetical protein
MIEFTEYRPNPAAPRDPGFLPIAAVRSVERRDFPPNRRFVE